MYAIFFWHCAIIFRTLFKCILINRYSHFVPQILPWEKGHIGLCLWRLPRPSIAIFLLYPTGNPYHPFHSRLYSSVNFEQKFYICRLYNFFHLKKTHLSHNMDYYLWECLEYDYYYKCLSIVYAYTSMFLCKCVYLRRGLCWSSCCFVFVSVLIKGYAIVCFHLFCTSTTMYIVPTIYQVYS